MGWSPTETSTNTTHKPQAVAQGGVVETVELGHAFGNVAALHQVNVEIGPREAFGLIGPSGCGKTTFLRLAGGLARPTGGTLRVFGQTPTNFSPPERARIGYVPQHFALYDNLTVEQNARFMAGLYGMGWRHRRRRIRELLDYYELWPARRRRASDISGGMLRRLSIACAVLHQPSLLLIDEPTAGLDPLLRARVWEHLKDLRDGGSTVLVTTQYIDEATNCDRVAVMRAGSRAS